MNVFIYIFIFFCLQCILLSFLVTLTVYGTPRFREQIRALWLAGRKCRRSERGVVFASTVYRWI